MIEQAILGRAKMHFPLATTHAMRGAVDHDVAKGYEVICQRGADAAHDRADAGEQLRHGEGLRHIIIRTRIKAADAIRFLAARGDHDDRHVPRFRTPAQTAAKLDAGNTRQHPVKQYEIGRHFPGEKRCFFAIARGDDGVAFLVEIILKQR